MIAAIEVLQYDFMRRALLAAVMIGLSAPAVGIFLVQRRLALIGDGLGHIAVSGVALGLVVGHAPIFIALVTAIVGAVAIELIRARGEAFGEIALAMLFYGGIAGGVVLVSRAPAGTRNLNQYLFGSITTTSASDLITFSILAAVILALTTWLGPAPVRGEQRRRVRSRQRAAGDAAEHHCWRYSRPARWSSRCASSGCCSSAR